MHPYSTAPPEPKGSWQRIGLAVAIGCALGAGATFAVMEITKPSESAHASAKHVTAAPSPEMVTMTGTISMSQHDSDYDPEFDTANWGSDGSGGCEGKGGYSDMAEGANVTVYNATGAVVGSGYLLGGQPSGLNCKWQFTVESLPQSPFYQVEVSHRGKVTVQSGEVTSVSLTLGD